MQGPGQEQWRTFLHTAMIAPTTETPQVRGKPANPHQAARDGLEQWHMAADLSRSLTRSHTFVDDSFLLDRLTLILLVSALNCRLLNVSGPVTQAGRSAVGSL